MKRNWWKSRIIFLWENEHLVLFASCCYTVKTVKLGKPVQTCLTNTAYSLKLEPYSHLDFFEL